MGPCHAMLLMIVVRATDGHYMNLESAQVGCLTLPPKTVSLAEWLNLGKENDQPEPVIWLGRSVDAVCTAGRHFFRQNRSRHRSAIGP